jgi:hypothetical protein
MLTIPCINQIICFFQICRLTCLIRLDLCNIKSAHSCLAESQPWTPNVLMMQHCPWLLRRSEAGESRNYIDTASSCALQVQHLYARFSPIPSENTPNSKTQPFLPYSSFCLHTIIMTRYCPKQKKPISSCKWKDDRMIWMGILINSQIRIYIL